jgi:hypothetical protein
MTVKVIAESSPIRDIIVKIPICWDRRMTVVLYVQLELLDPLYMPCS